MRFLLPFVLPLLVVACASTSRTVTPTVEPERSQPVPLPIDGAKQVPLTDLYDATNPLLAGCDAYRAEPDGILMQLLVCDLGAVLDTRSIQPVDQDRLVDDAMKSYVDQGRSIAIEEATLGTRRLTILREDLDTGPERLPMVQFLLANPDAQGLPQSLTCTNRADPTGESTRRENWCRDILALLAIPEGEPLFEDRFMTIELPAPAEGE